MHMYDNANAWATSMMPDPGKDSRWSLLVVPDGWGKPSGGWCHSNLAHFRGIWYDVLQVPAALHHSCTVMCSLMRNHRSSVRWGSLVRCLGTLSIIIVSRQY